MKILVSATAIALTLCPTIAASTVFGQAAAAPGAKPVLPAGLEPIELLKKARGQFEEIPAEFRNVRAIVPLAVGECLYGDKESGLAHFAKALETAGREPMWRDRFFDYAVIVRAQALAGLPDDVKATVRHALDDAKKIPKDEFSPGDFHIVFGQFVIRSLASLGADDEARRFIDTLPGRIGDLGFQRQGYYDYVNDAALMRAQLKRGDKAAAKATLVKLEADYPQTVKFASTVPSLWFLLGERDQAFERIEAFVRRHTGDPQTAHLVEDVYREAAFACLEKGDQVKGAEYFELSRKASAGPPGESIRFKISVGDFTAAADQARAGNFGRSRPDNLRKIGLAAIRAGKPAVGEGLFREADELEAKQPAANDPLGAASAKLEAASYRLAGGDLGAMVQAADAAKIPMMQYVANLITVVEIHVRTTGRGENIFQSELEF
jgi:hypothetical protein